MRCNTMQIENDGMNRDHGSLYDRGGADSYYGRRQEPHYYIGGSRIEDLNKEQIAEYRAGYIENDDFKDWG